MTAEQQQTAPLDLETMRAAARRMLAEDAEPPCESELETLTLQLRGHLMLAIPVVEELASRFPEDDVPRACAHAAVMEAHVRLGVKRGWTLPSQFSYAQRLARSVNALCDHYENLSSEQPAVLDPERAALLRLSNHCLTCPTCMTTDDVTGVNANLPCEDADRLYKAYREAQHSHCAAAPTGRAPAVMICNRCDQPIVLPGEPFTEIDKMSPSGAGTTLYRHDRPCRRVPTQSNQ